MPRFKDVVKEDFKPTPAQLECFQKALSQLNDNVKTAHEDTTHKKSFGIGPLSIDWTSTDEDEYARLKENAEHQYEAALRGCIG